MNLLLGIFIGIVLGLAIPPFYKWVVALVTKKEQSGMALSRGMNAPAKKKGFNWIAGVIALGFVLAAFLGIRLGISKSGEFNVRHSPAVEQTVDANGTYVAGSPEIYHIDASGALVLELIKKNNKVWVIIAFILAGVFGLFILAYANGWVSFGAGSSGAGNVSYVLLVGALACYIAAYSSAFTSNFIEIPADQYEKVKGDNEAIKQLFLDKKHYIR